MGWSERFTVSRKSLRIRRGTPGAPENLRLRHGDVSGSLVARYRAQRQPSTNEVQTTTGNPNTESDWRTVGIFRGQKVDITGLSPGTTVWVRTHLGPQGPRG